MDIITLIAAIGLTALLFVILGAAGFSPPDIVGYPSFTSLMEFIFAGCFCFLILYSIASRNGGINSGGKDYGYEQSMVNKKTVKKTSRKAKPKAKKVVYGGADYGGDTWTFPSEGVILYEYSDGRKYIGTYKKDDKFGYFLWHGRGIYTHANGARYEGEFKDDKRHGRGTYTSKEYSQVHRLMEQKDPDVVLNLKGEMFVGQWKDHRLHKGTYKWEEWMPYEDESGKEYRWFESASYEGEFKDGEFDGKGIYTEGLDIYDGEWKDGKKHGIAIVTWPETIEMDTGKIIREAGKKELRFKNGVEIKEEDLADIHTRSTEKSVQTKETSISGYNFSTYEERAGDVLERFVHKMFKKRNCTIIDSQKQDNDGVDLLVKDHATNVRIGIQCKNQSTKMKNIDVRKYIPAIKMYELDMLIIVCTNGFYVGAEYYKEPKLFLWDRDRLEKEANKEGMSWFALIEEFKNSKSQK